MRVWIARDKCGDEADGDIEEVVNLFVVDRPQNTQDDERDHPDDVFWWSDGGPTDCDFLEHLLYASGVDIHPGECREYELTLTPVEDPT